MITLLKNIHIINNIFHALAAKIGTNCLAKTHLEGVVAIIILEAWNLNCDWALLKSAASSLVLSLTIPMATVMGDIGTRWSPLVHRA